jgi:hypothetical protein
MADWRLTSCCGHQQIAFIATVGAFIFVILALWRTPILDPFKLITVFLHEASHATACKLTCGKVEGMEVTADEGGVTHTRGGYQWFILPAGYLGSSFWGMVLVISSTNSITLRIAAALLIISLVVVLIIAKNVRNLQFLYSDSQNLDFICNGNLQQKVILNCMLKHVKIGDGRKSTSCPPSLCRWVLNNSLLNSQ